MSANYIAVDQWAHLKQRETWKFVSHFTLYGAACELEFYVSKSNEFTHTQHAQNPIVYPHGCNIM